MVSDAFDRLGPTPRICVENLHLEGTLEVYERGLNRTILGITTDQLQKMFNGALALDMDGVSHKISLISRLVRDDVHSRPVVRPITQFIQTRLANRFRSLERAEQVRLYNLFSRVPDSRATAGSTTPSGWDCSPIHSNGEEEVAPLALKPHNVSLEAFRQQALLQQFKVNIKR
jgi:hypothetical protein